MAPDTLYKTYPYLYHMAHHAALPGIEKHGLLSTEALLELFEVPEARAAQIMTTMRKSSVEISHPHFGKAVIRDQKPIVSDARLARALGGSATAADFHRILNSKVFFWVREERVFGLRHAKEYRGDPQLILTLDTRKVLEHYADKVWLCPMNSGSCRPMAHPRTPGVFQRLKDFDFEASRRRRTVSRAIVEFAVEHSVEDISRFLVKTQFVGE